MGYGKIVRIRWIKWFVVNYIVYRWENRNVNLEFLILNVFIYKLGERVS